MKYLKERKKDKCPANRFVLALFIVPLEMPDWERLRPCAKEHCPESFIVSMELCDHCPDARTIWIRSDETVTVQCSYFQSKSEGE